MKRFAHLFLLLCLVLLPLLAHSQQKAKPKMVLTQTTYDAGSVFRSGEKIEHAFVVKNAGTAALEILSVTPG